MLRYLTHKLRTQSLNEEQPFQYKANDDHDSGTESDDEHGGPDDEDTGMEPSDRCSDLIRMGMEECNNSGGGRMEECNSSGGAGGREKENLRLENRPGRDSSIDSPLDQCFTDSALPSDSDHNYDHHSSEEELEVINSAPGPEREAASSASFPEKRKWSEVNRVSSGDSSCSSDEEVSAYMCAKSTPVEFSSSPPLDAHKPGAGRCQSPPTKVPHYSTVSEDRLPLPSSTSIVSPRKRRTKTHSIQRPCLDFEKMQQIKDRAVTTWRQGGELSLYCW